MLTYKVTKRGVLGKDGKELPIGAEVKYPRAVSKPWSDRLELISGTDSTNASAKLTTQVEPQDESKPEPQPEPEAQDLTEPAPDEPTAGEDGSEYEEVDLDELDDEQVRQLAKEYGIKSWHNKSIDKLKEELISVDG